MNRPDFSPVSTHPKRPRFMRLGQARQLTIAMGLAFTTFSFDSLAGDLDGTTADVNAGDAVESWTLVNGATLNVNSGGVTDQIDSQASSTLNIDGGTVNASNTSFGVRLGNGSIGSITNATIVNTDGRGLALANNLSAPGNTLSPTATVVNSSITGRQFGASVTAGGNLTLSGTEVIGNDNGGANTFSGGIGLALFDGNVSATNGSVVTGDRNGALITNRASDLGSISETNLALDGSSIEGRTGSAIRIVTTLAGFEANADITIQNGSTLIGGNGIILEVDDRSSANFKVDNSTLVGDVVVEEGGSADVTLRNNASLTGNLINVENLTLDDGGTWHMVGDGSVTNVTMDGGAIAISDGTGTSFNTLTIGTLSGDGTFNMAVDLVADRGDFLNVTGMATGDYQLNIRNTGLDPVKGQDELQVVHTGGGGAEFNLVGGQMDYGTFAYELEQRGDDWYLVQLFDDDGGPVVTPGTRSVVGLFSAAPTVWYGELSTLRSRMGELRNGQTNGGLWMRAYNNKYNASAGGGVAYQQNQRGVSFGADAPLPSVSGEWLFGVLGGYSKSDLDLKAGTAGEVDSYYVGAYTTWLSESGYYLDAIVKANRFMNESNVRMSDGRKAGGSYNTYGIGTSVEFGKHIDLPGNWFVEPFTQVSALWVKGEDYGLDNGMEAEGNKADSLLGKLGGTLGFNHTTADGGLVQPYLKLAVVEEFSKTNTVKVNGNRFNNDLSGTRGEIGAGLAIQMSEKLQLHTDLEYSNGDKIEQPWGYTLGMRYSW